MSVSPTTSLNIMRSALALAAMAHLGKVRSQVGLSTEELEQLLALAPGWIDHFESGDGDITLDDLAAMVSALEVDAQSFLRSLRVTEQANPRRLRRAFHGVAEVGGLTVRFPYGRHSASFYFENATLPELTDVVNQLRNGLATQSRQSSESDNQAVKASAVATCFLKAVQLWPTINPSDIWYFIVYRAYLDRYNHPASFARLDLGQSWRRTGGWALERVLINYYGPHLKQYGINLTNKSGSDTAYLLEQLDTPHRLEADKVDVILTGDIDGHETLFGVIHVKTSFAERRTDDVPMSQALIDAGYYSPLWTMDAKATPSRFPRNRGELGRVATELEDRRSAKRRDIEDDGYFSACFSYNKNTLSTPRNQIVQAPIVVCDFGDPDDEFSQAVIRAWETFKAWAV